MGCEYLYNKTLYNSYKGMLVWYLVALSFDL